MIGSILIVLFLIGYVIRLLLFNAGFKPKEHPMGIISLVIIIGSAVAFLSLQLFCPNVLLWGGY